MFTSKCHLLAASYHRLEQPRSRPQLSLLITCIIRYDSIKTYFCETWTKLDTYIGGGLAYSGNVVGHINKVTLRQARLVLRWVTVYGRVNHLGM